MSGRSIYERIMTARFETTGGLPVAPRSSGRSGRAISLMAVLGIAIVGCGSVLAYESVASPVDAAQGSLASQTPGPILPGSVAQPQSQQGGSDLANAARTVPTGAFAAYAAGAGANTCAKTYADLGNGLTDGTQFMVSTQSSKLEADRHSLQGVVGMTFRSDTGYSGPAAGLIFASPVGSDCEGAMARVVPFQQNCKDTVAMLPQGSQPLPSLMDLPVYALASGGEVMFMPAGSGCVAISVIHARG